MRPRSLVALAAAGAALLAPAPATAAHAQVSIFQDDYRLIYAPTATVIQTLATLHSLGVQMLRVTVKWSALAPDPHSTKRPAGFDASDPNAYPWTAWINYDRILILASRDHIRVQFLLTAPGPLWAMYPSYPTSRAADHWAPNPGEFANFVTAVAKRYDGTYRASYGPIPRVSNWAIWNEPDQPGWLAPQYGTIHGHPVPVSPWLYRLYVRGGFAALEAAGHRHGRDTILIGELAPEGVPAHGYYDAMPPMPFLRALYCVDTRYRPLRGTAASALGCPGRPNPGAFVAANPGLFHASGFGHHPYYFFHPPSDASSNPDYVPIADLARLEHGLDRAFAAYRVHRRLPIFLTEYGYETNPPNPYQVVTPAQQARYLNQADYMAWSDPRVRSVAQYLLYDSEPNRKYSPSQFQYWATFQTGLEFADGRPKPALWAYRMPIWIPQPRGARVLVWGQLRPASDLAAIQPQRAQIQWRARGAGTTWRAIAALTVDSPDAYFMSRVRLPGTGYVRIAYRRIYSRAVAVAAG